MADHDPKVATIKEERQQTSIANDLFEDMGRKVEGMTMQDDVIGEPGAGDATDQKMVEEIESLCMNCHDEVRFASETTAFHVETK